MVGDVAYVLSCEVLIFFGEAPVMGRSPLVCRIPTKVHISVLRPAQPAPRPQNLQGTLD